MAIRQMLAECYLDSVEDAEELKERLLFGNNHYDFNSDPSVSILDGKVRFPNTLAVQVVEEIRIVDHHKNDATGFSATLTYDSKTKSYVLSFRSTEYRNASKGGDFERDGGLIVDGADDEIVKYGFALAQLVAMERYYQEVRAKLTHEATLNVTGYSLGGHLATVFFQLHSEEIAETFLFNSPGRGNVRAIPGLTEAEVIRRMLNRVEELLFDPASNISHALAEPGGMELFLAASQRALEDPTWDPFEAGSSEKIYLDVRYRWARFVASLEFAPDYAFFENVLQGAEFSKVTSIVGHATHGDGTLVANSQNHVKSSYVLIEDQPTFDQRGGLLGMDGDFGTTHSLTLIVDSLALQKLILTLDPSLEQADAERLIAASSFQKATGTTLVAGLAEGDSLESALDVLYRALGGADGALVVPRETGQFGNIDTRDRFYGRIREVEELASGAGGTFRIEDLSKKSAWELVRTASGKTGDEQAALAYRYALRNLDPFVLLGVDYAKHNKNNELALRNPESEQEGMSEEWLRDRAALLSALNEARMENKEVDADTRHATAATGRTLFSYADLPGGRGIVAPDGLFLATQFVTFDGSEASTIFGGNLADSLYGGGGSDTLHGLEGNDHLEGGADGDTLRGGTGDDVLRGDAGDDYLYGESGDDRLEGGSGTDLLVGGADSDQLYGGAGADHLDGGPGNDLLNGGAGDDTYVYRSGEGVDTIEDSDGIGRLVIDGWTLTSPADGFRRIGDTWFGTANGQYYSFYLETSEAGTNTLTISGLFQGQIRIRNFRNGDLGLTLGGMADEGQILPTSTALLIDTLDGSDPFGTSGADRAIPIADFVNFLGLGGDDVIGGGSGDWQTLVLHGNGGNDVLIGSDKEDGEYHGDRLWGGGGADRLFGGKDCDELYGDSYALFSEDSFLVDQFGYPFVGDIEENGGYYRMSETGEPYETYFRLHMDGVSALKWVLGMQDDDDLDTFYNDFLDGGDGDDRIDGMAGSDHLYGGCGDDVLIGDSQVIKSLDPAPLELVRLLGKFGDDYLDGGEGDDVLIDEVAGNDVFIGGGGNDSIRNWDRLSYPSEALKIAHLAESLSGTERFNNYLDGGDGDDILDSINEFSGGRDVLVGGPGNDVLKSYSWHGEVFLYGGEGNDTLQLPVNGIGYADGGEGDDTYTAVLFGGHIRTITGFPGDFQAFSSHIRDSDFGSNLDTLQLRIYATIDELTIVRSGDDLVLGTDADDSWLTVENWFLGPEWKLERIVIQSYADWMTFQSVETQWDILEVERRVVWQGTDGPDRMVGGAIGQTIKGGAGNDVIEGGEGDDLLYGGAGSDVFRFGARSGSDVVINDESSAGDFDSVVIEEGLVQADIEVEKSGNDLRLVVREAQSVLTLADWFLESAGRVDTVRFSDGTTWTAMQLRDWGLGNHAPVPTQRIRNQSIRKGQSFSYQLPEGLFVDPDPGDELTFGVSLASGGKLPTWLTFDPESQLLTGEPSEVPEAGIELRVTARDRIGSEASLAFYLLPAAGNAAPEVVPETPHQGLRLLGDGSNQTLSGLSGDDYIEGGGGADTLYGKGGHDYLVGGTGNDVLYGEAGNDILIGGVGDDQLAGGSGRNFLNGGDGKDQLSDEAADPSSRSLFIGGRGDDLIRVGTAKSVVAFNVGDGHDVVQVDPGASATLSIGGRMALNDLKLSRHGDDLRLTVSKTDQLTFRDWYARGDGPAVPTLQLVLGDALNPGSIGEGVLTHRVEVFDFQAVVEAWEATGIIDPWAMADALLDAHLYGSDTEALGSDLAYRYGIGGNVDRLSAARVQANLSDAAFGVEPQAITLPTFSGLSTAKFGNLGLN